MCVPVCRRIHVPSELGPGHTATSTGLQPMGWGLWPQSPLMASCHLPCQAPSAHGESPTCWAPPRPPTSCPHSVSRIPALCLHGYLKPVSASGLSCCPHPVPALPDQVALRVAASGLCVRAGLWLPEPR